MKSLALAMSATLLVYVHENLSAQIPQDKLVLIDGFYGPITNMRTEYTPPPLSDLLTPGQIFFQSGFEESWTFGAPPGWTSTAGNTDSTWHRNDFNTGWSTAAGIIRSPGSFTSNYVVSFMGGYSARFHTFDTPFGRRGFMTTPNIDLSSASDSIFVSFWWTNTSGSDSLKVYVSTDGGATFPTLIGFVGSTGGPWYMARGYVPSISATTKLRFEANSDAGYDDILLDEIAVYQKGPGYSGTLTLPGAFSGFSDAARRLSIFGVSGPVTINVTAGTYSDSVTFPPIPGSSIANTITFTVIGGAVTLQRDGVLMASTTTVGATSARSDDFVIGLWGADYFTFDGIGVQGGVNTEWGFWVRSATPDDGANNNTIQNASIAMNTTNTSGTSTQGIRHSPFWTLTAQSGASSNNHYYNNNIQSCSSRGIFLQGSAPYLDLNNEVASIGGGTANFSNIFTTSTFAPAAIAFGGQNGVSIHNVIIDSVASTPSFGSVIGIIVGTSTGATDSVVNFRIYSNTIRRIVHSGVGAANILSAIRIATTPNALRGTIYNNFISNLRASDTTPDAIDAVYQGGGINTNIGWYYNTVLLDNAVIGTNGGNGVVRIDAGTATFRNNVFVNRSAQSGTGKNYVYNRTGGTINASNNAVYIDTALTNRFVGFYTIDRKTLTSWQSAVSNLDVQSLYTDPSFVNSATLPYDLHINPAGPTGLESGGMNISGVTIDYDGDTRVVGPAMPSSVVNPNSAPDIGADEFNGTPSDVVPPLMTYSVLGNTTLTTNRSLMAIITDAASGVDRRPGLTPRLYFRKNSGSSYFSDTAGVNVGNDWTFTLNHSALGGVIAGDTVFYYVAAADSSGNVGTNPPGGSGLPPGSSPPITTNFYFVRPSISGTVTIGAGGTFATVKALFDSVNASILTGDLTANIVSNVTESATATLNPLNYLNGIQRTVRLQPSGGSRTVSGAIAGALLDFNGADYVTIDGLGKTLTLSNTSTAGQTIQFRNDATFDTVRSSIIRGSNTSTTSGTIVFGTSLSPFGGMTGNRSNAIVNNDIQGATTLPANAVYSSGTADPASNGSNSITANNIFDWSANGISVAATGNSGNWVISDNSFYDTLVTTPTRSRTSINFIPGTLSGENLISGNLIGGGAPNAGGGAWTTTDTLFVGIALNTSLVNPSSVSSNTIQNISLTAVTDGVIFRGITTTGGSTTITNNTIGHPTNPNSIVNAGNGPRGIGSRPTTAIMSSAAGGTAATVVNIISGNTIANISTTGTTISNRISAIENGGSSSIATINNNTIHDLYSSSTHNNILGGQVTVMGIFVSGGTIGAPAQAEIKNNTIYTLVAANPADSATNVSAISYSNNHVGVIENNLIYDLRNASNRNVPTTPSTATGIYVRAIGGGGGVTDGVCQLVNNMISLGSDQTTNTQFMGMWQGFNTAGKLVMLHNSVRIGGSVISGSIPSFGFLRGLNTGVSLNTPIYMRNTVLSNTRTGGTGKHYAIGNQSTAANPAGWNAAATDFNILFTQNLATLGLWGVGDSTFAGWKSVSGGDNNSVNADPQFVSLTNLHINPLSAVPSPAASRGIPVGGYAGGITTDIDGQARNGSTPDIGADEFNLARPSGFLLVGPSNNSTGQALSGTLTWQNASGSSFFDVFFDTNNPPTTRVSANQAATTYDYSVSQEGTTFYWNVVAKNVDSTRTSSNGPFNFRTIAPAFGIVPGSLNFGSVTVGQSRMDSATVTNTGTAVLVIDSVKANSARFSVAPSGAVIFPLESEKFFVTFTPTTSGLASGGVVFFHNSPNLRDTLPVSGIGILPGLSGSYTVGAGGNFSTLSAAIAALNSAGVAAPVTFTFTDASYTDTAQIVSPYAGQGASNPVTFKPASGVTTRIVFTGGTNTFAVRMDSASYITWDGSNSGGTDRSLTLEVDTVTPSRNVFLIRKGSHYLTFKNLIMKGNRRAASSSNDVFRMDNQTFGASGAQHDITVDNCHLLRGLGGIFARGASGAVLDYNLAFTRNLVGGGDGATLLDNLAGTGILMEGNRNVLVDRNDINGIKVTGTPQGARIQGANDGVTFTRNKIHNLVTLSGAFSPISVLIGNIIATGPAVKTRAYVANNMIYDIHNFGTGTGGRSFRGIVYNPTGPPNTPNGNGSTVEYYNNTWHVDYTSSEGVGLFTNFIFDANFSGTNATPGHVDSIIFINNVASSRRADTLAASRMWLIIGPSGTPGSRIIRSDYNAYYYTLGPFAQIPTPYPDGAGAFFCTNLQQFRDTTGLDLSSIFGDPRFVSATNAHIRTDVATPVESRGTPIAGLTTDIDGDPRNATTPDVGADEGTFIPYALGAVTASFDSVTAQVTLSWGPPSAPSSLSAGTMDAETDNVSSGEATKKIRRDVTSVSGGLSSLVMEKLTRFAQAEATNGRSGGEQEVLSPAPLAVLPASGVVAGGHSGQDNDFGRFEPVFVPEPSESELGSSHAAGSVIQPLQETLTRTAGIEEPRDAAASLVRFRIFRSVAGGAFVQIDSVSAATTSYLDTRVQSRSYAYYLVAVFDDGTSQPSPTANVNVPFIRAEVEPNNTAATANYSTLGYNINATLTSSDADWFRFTAPVGHLIADGTNTGNTTDVIVGLYDSSGTQQLYEVDRNINDRLEFNLSYAGVYYVRITPYTTSTGPYTLFARIGAGTDPGEPDDGPLLGFPLVARSINVVGYRDTLSTINPGVGLPGFDMDYRYFRLTAGQQVTAILRTRTTFPTSSMNGGYLGIGRKGSAASLVPQLFGGAPLASGFSTTGANVTVSHTATVTDTFYVFVSIHLQSPSPFGFDQAGPNARYDVVIDRTVGVEETAELPEVFALDQNYPNPFNPSTQIKYALPKESVVTLKVFNMLGQEVATLTEGIQSAGYHAAEWDGRNRAGGRVSTGAYIYRMEALPTDGGAPFISIKKMVFLR